MGGELCRIEMFGQLYSEIKNYAKGFETKTFYIFEYEYKRTEFFNDCIL